jgi:hypothetical protein
MPDGPRLLVAAALGKVIEPFLQQSMSDATVRVAEDQAAVERAIGDRLRFDVVIADLTWNDYAVARLAGAIASGRAVNHETLASSAHVGYDTAAKLVDYLGPLIRDRGEHSPELKMTPEVVYRWCGEHARYILSWCRRNGYADIATRVMPADRAESSAGAAVGFPARLPAGRVRPPPDAQLIHGRARPEARPQEGR